MKTKTLWRTLAAVLIFTSLAGFIPQGAAAYNSEKDLVEAETYYFDLSSYTAVAGGSETDSATSGKINNGSGTQLMINDIQVVDDSFTWTPFVYTGSVSTSDATAYVLNENSVGVADASDTAAVASGKDGSEYGGYYDHSLFLSEYALVNYISWDRLHSLGLIFGTDYKVNGVDYLMRSLSSGNMQYNGGTIVYALPGNTEYDILLAKGAGKTLWEYQNSGGDYFYNAMIKNAAIGISSGSHIYTWGQDSILSEAYRSIRGGNVYARSVSAFGKASTYPHNAWRPALEIMNDADLTSIELIVSEGTLNYSDARVPLTDAKVVYGKTGTINLPVPANYTGDTGGGLGWYTNPDFTGEFFAVGSHNASELADVAKLYYGLGEEPEPAPEPTPPIETHTAYIFGYPDGTFKPHANMTRAEATVAFVRNYVSDFDLNGNYTNTYTDVSENAWYARDIGAAEQAGLIDAAIDGKFRPDDPITREDFAVIASRATGTEPNAWLQSVEFLTRAKAVEIINDVLGRSATAESVSDFNYIVFPDVNESDMFFYDVIEAANTHDFIVEGGKEIWVRNP